MKKTITTLVTHDGNFHADDVMSTAILTDLYPQAAIVRSRDQSRISPAEGRIVYDVGLKFDPDLFMFDHHQNDAPVREDGVPFSSIGLIWREFGAQWLLQRGIPLEDIPHVHAKIDKGMIRTIDRLDTGDLAPGAAGEFSGLSLSSIIEDMSPVFDNDDPLLLDKRFMQAVAYAKNAITMRSDVIASKIRAERAVLQAIEASGVSPVLELPRGMPFDGPIRKAGAEHILFVVAPREKGWTISTVREKQGSYASRKDLPSAWAGLSGAELAAETGVKDAIFCHKALFLAAAETRSGILELARQAIDFVPENSVLGV